MQPKVAALFIDPKGPYTDRSDVEAWGESRDARNYCGPLPVVAHPPCQRWINFAALNFKRYGGEHNRPGNDGGCFASALKSVRIWGGLLEHPYGSKAFRAHELSTPRGSGWICLGGGEWFCEVWQSAYGHRARKRTWLYYVSKNEQPPTDLRFERKPGTHQCGWFDRKKPTLGKREASLTPPSFAEALIQLAIGSRI
jgi:hypothetical protein